MACLIYMQEKHKGNKQHHYRQSVAAGGYFAAAGDKSWNETVHPDGAWVISKVLVHGKLSCRSVTLAHATRAIRRKSFFS